MTTATNDRLSELPAVRAGALNGALFVALVLAGRFEASVAAVTAVTVVAVALGTSRLPMGYAVLTGLTTWACLTGFVVNELGQLTFAPLDLACLALLMFVSVAAGLVRLPPRAHTHPHSQPTRRNTAYRAAPTTTMSSIAKG